MIFPDYAVDIGADSEEQAARRGKTLEFDFSAGDFVMKDGRLQSVEGEDALRVRIEKCIRTEADKYQIYLQDGTPYGVKTFDLTNRKLPQAFLFAEIEREVTEALLRDSDVTGVYAFEFDREGRTLSVEFTVESIFGEQEAGYKWLIV